MIVILRIDRLWGQICDNSAKFGKSAYIHLIGSPYAANIPREPREWSPKVFSDKFMHFLKVISEK